MDFRRSLDFETVFEYDNLSDSTEEILWSDDETIVAEQEHIWNEGRYHLKFILLISLRAIAPNSK